MAESIETTQIGGTTIDAHLDAIGIEMAHFLGLTIRIRCALIFGHTTT